MNVSWNLIGLIFSQNASQTLPKKLERNDFTHRHMRTKYLIFLGKWHQNRRLSGHNIVFSGLIIWDIFMMRYFQVSWDGNFNLNRLKTEPLESTFGVSPIRISDFVCMFGPIRSELNWPAIGLAPFKVEPTVIQYDVTFITQHITQSYEVYVRNIWFLSPLVLSKWENLALLSLYTFWGKCVYFSIFEW